MRALKSTFLNGIRKLSANIKIKKSSSLLYVTKRSNYLYIIYVHIFALLAIIPYPLHTHTLYKLILYTYSNSTLEYTRRENLIESHRDFVILRRTVANAITPTHRLKSTSSVSDQTYTYIGAHHDRVIIRCYRPDLSLSRGCSSFSLPRYRKQLSAPL